MPGRLLDGALHMQETHLTPDCTICRALPRPLACRQTSNDVGRDQLAADRIKQSALVQKHPIEVFLQSCSTYGWDASVTSMAFMKITGSKCNSQMRPTCARWASCRADATLSSIIWVERLPRTAIWRGSGGSCAALGACCRHTFFQCLCRYMNCFNYGSQLK